MATYLSRSNAQEDGVQTLHLMNSGFSGYTDASNAGNLVLVSPSAGAGQNNSVGYSSQQQQQQHFIGFQMPAAITQSSLPQQSALTTMYNSSVGQQNPSSNLFTNSSTYNWTAVNELPLIPSNDVTSINPSLTARLTSMNSGQQSNPDISQFNMRRQFLHDEQASMLNNGIALGLNMDSSQASDGANRGLSLSLSSQQQSAQMQYYNLQPDESGMSSCPGLGHVAVEDSANRGERAPSKWIGSLSHFRACSRDGLLGSGFQNSTNDINSRHMHMESNVSTVVGPGGLLTGSKYLKAAQQLLDEVVSVARVVKSSSSKHLKLQAWMAPNSFMDGSCARNGSLPEAVTTAKEGTAGTTSIPSFASGPEQNSSTVIELTREERQELQTKKAKLIAMLDEVDRRYKQYYSQMEMVVTSFESAAGLGAAKTYTALALQTISRHFRCLRDAIIGQIRVASRALGEENFSSPCLGRGETPRLRYLDQQLRQQRALQQLGMMQQHAWRPQRGLPERSVSILRAWLFEHFLHPYPKDSDKLTLARQTGLTRNQVSNWFINARVRLWKPMVEEMYLEETKESDRDRTPSADQRSTGDKCRSGRGDEDGTGSPEDSNHGLKQGRTEAVGIDCGAASETQLMSAHTQSASDMLQQAAARKEARSNLVADSTAADANLCQDERGVKKARNDSSQRDSLAAATMFAGADVHEFNSDSNKSEESFEHESKNSFTMRGIHHAFADYLVGGGAGRYVQEEFPDPRYANVGGGSNSVSLTLGLQHCDGLSLDGAHQQQRFYHHQESHDDAAVVAAAAAQDYYSMNNSSNFEALAQLQGRKRFASQLLHHDFIA